MISRSLFAMTLAAACSAQAANAADNSGCKLQIVANPSQWRLSDIDVFSSDPSVGSFDLQLINTGTGSCTGRLTLDTQGVPFGVSANGGQRIPYTILDHANGTDLTPRNGRARVNLGPVLQLAAGGQSLARFDVIFPNAFPTDGMYSQQVFVTLSEPGNGNVVAERPVTLAANVASSATIALSGNFRRVGGAADVDLGELSQGAIKVPLIVHVKSTRAYQITSSSENGGKLMLPGTNWSIPYSLSFGGSPVNPAGGVYRSSAGDKPRTDNFQLGFVIAGSTNLAAGRYSDVLTLSIAVN